MNKVVAIISFVVLAVSAAWFYKVPSYEPAIAFLVSVVAIIPSLFSISKKSGTWLNKIISPFVVSLEKKKPDVVVSFDALIGGKAERHTVYVKKVWYKTSPTIRSQVIHKTSSIDPYTILLIEQGGHFEIKCIDIDGDGNPEVALTYHCGGHSMGLAIFKVDYGHFLKQIPGSDIGSDWPGIKIEDRDNDGIMEVYAKNRNWSGSPCQESIEYKYVLVDGAFIEQAAHNLATSGDGDKARRP